MIETVYYMGIYFGSVRTILFSTLACLPIYAQVSYTREVLPILTARCQPCHQPQALIANPAKMISMISGAKPLMPKSGPPLNEAQVKLLTAWVAEGAKPGELWWSQRPLAKTTLPAVGHPVDSFIEAKLAEMKLAASPEADRRSLIRRLTYDLHGLPPTAEETSKLLADTATDGYERLVDRLLASPRYGERWARHWLDVVHYGDSHGYDKDKPRANAWPYRDYVIAAFNSDKPYSRFVEEQIAGDVMRPDDPQAIIATGFLAAGPWDFVGHQELREGTMDKNLSRLLDRDDMVAATMSTFVSQTVHCARCHDHKFDPIKQSDYYAVQSVFAGIDRADRPFDNDPVTSARRRELLKQRRVVQVELQPLSDKLENATSPELDRLDARIKDARLLAAHIAEPKNPEEAARKQALKERGDADTLIRKKLLDDYMGSEAMAKMATLAEQAKLLDQTMAALPKPQQVYAASNYFVRAGTFRPALTPRPVHLLRRGDVGSPAEEAMPGAIGQRFPVSDQNDEGSRRLALAGWIIDKNNALTWRSIVNRVWHYHFGQGIVDSPSDFGRMGSQPTHPELLDWLAVWFRDDAKGSLKQLHRLIVTSKAYRQTSANRADGAKLDAGNKYLWRMNRTRLDAESVRDSMLAVTGKLDLTMSGPAVRMFAFKDDHSPVYDYAGFDPTAPGANRRSIYRFLVRSVPDPFMDRLDCPDSALLTPKRSTTITAIQALAVLNNPFVLRMAEALAERGGNVRQCFRLALGRDSTPAELAELEAFAQKHGLVNVSRVLLNSNEFLFVD